MSLFVHFVVNLQIREFRIFRADIFERKLGEFADKAALWWLSSRL